MAMQLKDDHPIFVGFEAGFTGKQFALDDSAADDLAARVDLDLRQTRRAVVEAFAHALTAGKKAVEPKIPTFAGGRRSMGFM